MRREPVQPKPLDGVTVVDLGQVLAIPFETYLLHLLGAEGIKVERLGGEWLRSGHIRSFATQNAGKLGIAVDPRSPEGVEAVLRLVDGADVFVEGFASGTNGTMPGPTAPPPRLGEDSRSVLVSAGCTTGEIDDLIERGVIGEA